MRLQGKKSTTLLKQLNYYINNANGDTNKRKTVDEIRRNCIDNMIILCKLVRDVNTVELLQQLNVDLYNINDDEQKYSDTNDNQNCPSCKRKFMKKRTFTIHSVKLQTIAKNICNLWCNCPMIKKKFIMENNLIDNYDNMAYFYDKIHEIMHTNYTPTVNDIKRHKKSKTFVINNYKSIYNYFNNTKTVYYHEKNAIKLFTLPLFSNANIGFTIDIPDIFKHRFFDPINKNKFLKKLKVKKIFNSKTKPYLIDCYVENNINKQIMLSSQYILKKGDDMRYDYCVLKLFDKMNEIWKRNRLNTHCITYKCIPIGNNIGIIEMKSNCISLNKIADMQNIFLEDPHTFFKLIDTSVGAFIGSYVCGVRDRHYDNILVNKMNGELFNIDFGYVFGNQCNLDASKIAITKELKQIFDIYEFGWHKFIWSACKAWLILRQNANELIEFGTELFKFDSRYEKSNIIKLFLTDSLKLNMTCEMEAQKYIYDEMYNSANSIKTKMKNVWHDWEMWLF